MRLVAYAKLLNKKINSAHNKAKNPFLDGDFSLNPFRQPIFNTIVWIESDLDFPTSFPKTESSFNGFDGENTKKNFK